MSLRITDTNKIDIFMNDKFKNKYRTTSTRLQHWDYRWDGYYFITICTKDKEDYFGEIVNAEMRLSSIGIIANILWYEIKNHSKNIELDAFVVMPNHIHGILIMSDNEITAETRHALSLHAHTQLQTDNPTIGRRRFQNQGKNSISSIVGAYKSAVSRHAHRLGFDFSWQGRFYDNIIRDDKSHKKIVEYVQSNPLKWEEDRFYHKLNEGGCLNG